MKSLSLLNVAVIVCSFVFFLGCDPPPVPPDMTPEEELIAKGREIFFNETFEGNGRTCGTCHRAENNLTIDPSFIASLPPDDPLFVSETNPDLSENFENANLIRGVGLIFENQDGFGDLENNFNMRGVPHVFAQGVSIESAAGPRTGWSGDGAPGDGSLRSFATGAVIQHFTKTTNRIAGIDFRLPTDEELDALEAFQLALGRQAELTLPLTLKDPVVSRGQDIFNSVSEGKCFGCHFNGGANANPDIFGPGAGNLNFNTGVEDLPDQPADLLGEKNPPDDGFGNPGMGEFNTPSVIEAADTGPFFHNNAVETIEGAVEFYNGDAFNNSPAGQLLVNATGSGIKLEATQVIAVAAFLRVINAVENIRQSQELLEAAIFSKNLPQEDPANFLPRAVDEINDAVMVLKGGGLHPAAVRHLETADQLMRQATEGHGFSKRQSLVERAMAELKAARSDLIDAS